jgi:hypothetical protein
VLASSDNLVNWASHKVLLYEWEDERLIESQSKIGFQYVDWLFDGDNDIIFVSRTAYAGAHNYHDANYMTFHRLKNYKKYLSERM